MINIKRIFIMTKLILLAHILNPFWWSRDRRRARRCKVAGNLIPKYFKKYLPAVAKIVETPAVKDDVNEKIWTIWLQGEKNAPELVKACFSSIRKNCKQELVILDESNLFDYISFPDFIIEKRKQGVIKNAHFADLARVELLHTHGGIWLDSTAFTTAPIPQNIIDQDFFVYLAGNVGSPYGYVQNCFIRSRKGAYLLEAWRAMMHEYWRCESREFDYFMHQLMFKTLAHNDPRGIKHFANMEKIDQDPTHALWWEYADKPFDRKIFDKITQDAFFQKTAWKHKAASNPIPGSFADKMLNMYK